MCSSDLKLLLLDEPFGALDAKVRKELRGWLRDIHHELGITSILVTHDQEKALEVSDQIVVMNHGKIEQVGNAATLYRQPNNAFVTEFLGNTDAFEGCIEKGEWRYGEFAWPLDRQYRWQEQHAVGYIRPHEWETNTQNPMLAGTIANIHVSGALTHLTLALPEGRQFHVDFATSETGRLNLHIGCELKLSPRQVYVFGQSELIDYAI